MIGVDGALGHRTALPAAARRVVSLVPSETESMWLLGYGDRLVGRTDYCVEPVGCVEALASVGGTKNASVERIAALSPDLVLMNQEENTEAMFHALVARNITVHLCFPKTVGDAVGLMRDLVTLCGQAPDAHPAIAALEAGVAALEQTRREAPPVRVFCPIWMDPLMTIHGETFISDALDLAGGANVFADRTRRYPLAADLGDATPWSAEKTGARDVRYPRVTLNEVVARAPEVVLLPDEPHPFTDEDAEVFRALNIPAARAGRVHRVSGRDLSWYSPRMAEGIARIKARLSTLAPP